MKPHLSSDEARASELRASLIEDIAPVRFATHPNAPCVVNRLQVRRGRLVHNADPYSAKYASSYGAAEWLRDTMNRGADFGVVWYIAR